MVANTRVTLPQCRSVENWERTVKSSDGETVYTVYRDLSPEGHASGLACTCPGFKYRSDCKHVKAMIDEYCGWYSLIDDEPYEEGSKKCPRCGDEVDFRNHMV